jgi:hypothetical protein
MNGGRPPPPPPAAAAAAAAAAAGPESPGSPPKLPLLLLLGGGPALQMSHAKSNGMKDRQPRINSVFVTNWATMLPEYEAKEEGVSSTCSK